jgi:hypothetical protein
MHASNIPSSNIRGFGRRQPFVHAEPAEARSALGDDLQLFFGAFAAGFVFLTVFLA